MINKKIENQEEFINFVRQYCYLVDLELSKYERISVTDCSSVCKGLPKLISLVEVVGHLRGQDGCFIGTEIETVRKGLSSELYKNEDDFNSRLDSLIKHIKSDTLCATLISDYMNSHLSRFIKE